MGAFYTVAKLPVDETENFCTWCLSEIVYKDEETTTDKIGETIIMAPAAGFYTNLEMGKNQVRLAYVLCKKDLLRVLMILEQAIKKYNSMNNK